MKSPVPVVFDESRIEKPRQHHRGPVPVPVLRFGTILVPVDCTDRSGPLLAGAASIAHRLDADLVFLHVHEPVSYAPAHNTPGQLSHCQAAVHQSAEARLSESVRVFDGDQKIKAARLMTVAGDFGRAICNVAAEIDADLILVSTHGYCGLEHLFMGSKAEWIVRHAPCPVLVIPVRGS